MADMRQTRVEPKRADWGVYVAMNPDGTALSDSEGRVLSLNGLKNDRDAIRKMKAAAAGYGGLGCKIAFIPGSKQVTDNQHNDQMEAFVEGDEIPDDFDI